MRQALAIIDLPPVWLAAHIVAAWVLSLISPAIFGGFGDLAGVWLVGLGLLITLLAAAQMALARTTIIPRRDPSATAATDQHKTAMMSTCINGNDQSCDGAGSSSVRQRERFAVPAIRS